MNMLAGPAVSGKSLSFSQSEYGVPNTLVDGFGTARSKIETVHPLEEKIRQHCGPGLNPVQMSVLRNTQGLHAPLRLAVEMKAVRSVGRLPFLPSSNLSAATLVGNDDTIDFSDYLNPVEFNERHVNPQAVMDYKLGIL